MRRIILAGNPNTGKTTLFNTLANANEHAGNWHGVTVCVKEKECKIDKEKFVLCDLPGLYSLDGYSKEEQISSEFIENNQNAIVVCITDANNLKRNLFLALELKEKIKNLIIAVNMAKEVELDYSAISKELKTPVVPIDARTKKGIRPLISAIKEINQNNNVVALCDSYKNQCFNIKDFEHKAKVCFNKIDNVLEKSNYKPKGYYGSSKADKILLNGIFASFLFAVIMAVVFFVTFGPVGSFFSGLVSGLFESFKQYFMLIIQKVITSEGVLRFLEEGVLDGVLSVVSFLPQILLMFVCLNILEDVGYLSRVAVALDPLFKKIGLTGRSVFSLIMGFGCTTTAVITTRNLDNKSLRKRTTYLLPFMSCSAKLPIYAVICSAFFLRYKVVVVFLLYVLGVMIMLLVASFLKKFSKEDKNESFILEMPKFRIPRLKKVLKDSLFNLKSFLLRVGGVLLISSIVVFLLTNFAFPFRYVGANSGESILEKLARLISWIFIPLGFGSEGAVIGLLSGLIAKEMVVSSLAIVNGVSVSALASSLVLESSAVYFTTASAISFIVFVLLYSPCLSAIISIKKEAGTQVMLRSMLLQFVVAYVSSLIVFTLAILFEKRMFVIFALVIIFLACLITLMLKYKSKKKKVEIVSACLSCEGEHCGRNQIQRKRC